MSPSYIQLSLSLCAIQGCQAGGMSLGSPYQMFHSWQEQLHLLNKLLKLRESWFIILLQLQRQGCCHLLSKPEESLSSVERLIVQGLTGR